jgi:hypothetical protein
MSCERQHPLAVCEVEAALQCILLTIPNDLNCCSNSSNQTVPVLSPGKELSHEGWLAKHSSGKISGRRQPFCGPKIIVADKVLNLKLIHERKYGTTNAKEPEVNLAAVEFTWHGDLIQTNQPLGT